MFCKQNKALENLPPIQYILIQHVKRSIFQATKWAVANSTSLDIPSSEEWGWQKNTWTVETISGNHL